MLLYISQLYILFTPELLPHEAISADAKMDVSLKFVWHYVMILFSHCVSE